MKIVLLVKTYDCLFFSIDLIIGTLRIMILKINQRMAAYNSYNSIVPLEVVIESMLLLFEIEKGENTFLDIVYVHVKSGFHINGKLTACLSSHP